LNHGLALSVGTAQAGDSPAQRQLPRFNHNREDRMEEAELNDRIAKLRLQISEKLGDSDDSLETFENLIEQRTKWWCRCH
jgi:hypothetical protein